MCGIVGIIGNSDVIPSLIEGLRRLEYRGYDSAGIATLHDNVLTSSRAQGKLKALEDEIAKNPISGTIGIGHTRWATHGSPSVTNAHPHMTDKVAVIHNGIIENFMALRKELEGKGYVFVTQTDTEVVPVLITSYLDEGLTPKESVHQALQRLEGAFALGIMFAGEPNMLIAARQGSPLALGYGEGAMYLASDAYTLAPLTRQISYLHDGDWAVITKDSAQLYNKKGDEVTRDIAPTSLSGAAIGKGDYRHFMLKEIYEQPSVIGQTLSNVYDPLKGCIDLPEIPADCEQVVIIACGTSYYAGMTAQYWIESLADIPVRVDIASEFRYRKPSYGKAKQLVICISQSGETADTLAALQSAKAAGHKVLSIVNAQESSIERASDITLHTLAGPEIGVASTKAFTTQLVVLLAIALKLAQLKKTCSDEQMQRYMHALSELPSLAVEVLNHDQDIARLAKRLAEARDVLYIGRGTSYPIALEGALKLKELSYIHAEGVASGELKHGPIALIDENVPVIALLPSDEVFEKSASNIREVAARGGRIIAICDKDGAAAIADMEAQIIEIPKIHPLVAPILYAIPIQLLAYHTAVAKGTDIDQPRNLAKSVTVE